MSLPTYVERSAYWPPDPELVSTVHHLGDSLEVITTKHQPNDLSRYRRLNRSSYVDDTTGEVLSYKVSSDVSSTSVNRAFSRLYRLIITNFSKGVMVTLTVSGDYSADPSSLYRYFNQLYKKLRYHLSDNMDYLAVMEPHKLSGRFHLHVLFRSCDSPSFHLDQDTLTGYWSVGSVNVRRIFDVNGLALYLTSQKKRQAWRQWWQPHVKLYRTSRGITRPTTTKMRREEVKTYVEEHQLYFKGGHVFRVKRDNGDGTVSTLNVSTHEHFER